MRRIASSGLIGLGVFLIVAAALIKFYAYPNLAKTPTNYESETSLQGLGAQIFNSDPDVLESETTDLAITSRSVADSAADAPDGVAVWVNNTTIEREDGTIFQQQTERSPFDEVSGEAVDCDDCGQFYERTFVDADGEEAIERVDVTRCGQVYKFPFDTEKKDYAHWDGSINDCRDAVYEGEEEIDGLTVYKFVQTIEPTVVDERQVPGSVFGVDEDTVDAELVYENTRTFYVEPVTGAPVNRVENRNQNLVYDGIEVPAFVGTVEYTDAQVSEMVDDSKSKATMLGGMRLLFPLLALLVGLACVAGGLLLRRGDHTPPAGPSRRKDHELVPA